MKGKVGNTAELFLLLSQRLNEFVEVVKVKDGGLQATDIWSVDDVLRHVVFWHENYAANYKALAENRKPPIPKNPLNRLNLTGVESFRKFSRKQLITKLKKAHKSLEKSILINKVPKMKYSTKGMVYSSKEFLNIVEGHVRGHIKQIKRAKETI